MKDFLEIFVLVNMKKELDLLAECTRLCFERI